MLRQSSSELELEALAWPTAKHPYPISHVSLVLLWFLRRSHCYSADDTKSAELLDDYGALEPAISGKIMELHHKNHHQTYVNSYNDASEKLSNVLAKSDLPGQIALKPLLNFHGGGHINHSLFWENLAPKNSGGGEPPSGALKDAIDQAYGGLDGFKTKFNAALAAIQGSGWAWLVKDKDTGHISIRTYAVRRGRNLRRYERRRDLMKCAEPRSGRWHLCPPSWGRRVGACVLVSDKGTGAFP